MNHTDDTLRQVRRQRELLLFRYADAIANGNMDLVGAILQQAEHDPELEQGIWETHLALGAEIREEEERAIAANLAQNAGAVRQLAASHFSKPAETILPAAQLDEPEEEEIKPVTVAEVAADLKSRVRANPGMLNLLRKIERSNEPLGQDVSPRGIRTLLARLGIENAGKQFTTMFQDAVFALSMQRQGRAYRLAATRRQQSGGNRSNTTDRTQTDAAQPGDEPTNEEPKP